MRVRYEIFDEERYNEAIMTIEDLYPKDTPPTVEECTEVGTGEIAGFIKGGIFSEDMFLIADDKTNKFIKVKVSDCKKVEI